MRRTGVVVAALVVSLSTAGCGQAATKTSAIPNTLIGEAVIRSNDRTVVAWTTYGCSPKPYLVLSAGSKTVRAGIVSPPQYSGPCLAMLKMTTLTAGLEAPIGRRHLVEYVTGRPIRTVLEADLPEPSSLPAGYRLKQVVPLLYGVGGLPRTGGSSTQFYQRVGDAAPGLFLGEVPGRHLPRGDGWRSIGRRPGFGQAEAWMDTSGGHISQRAVAWLADRRTLVLESSPGTPACHVVHPTRHAEACNDGSSSAALTAVLSLPALLRTARSVAPKAR